MKKTGILLLLVGVLVALEALVRGQGSISVESAIFSLTLLNLAYTVYSKNGNKKEIKTYKDIQKAELERIKIQRTKLEDLNTEFDENEVRDKEFVSLINKFSNIRIESLLESTKDNYKKRELQRVLNKRRAY